MDFLSLYWYCIVHKSIICLYEIMQISKFAKNKCVNKSSQVKIVSSSSSHIVIKKED